MGCMMVIAHRGASGLAPENTLAAFRRAIRDGADWLELDVCASKDGAIVVIHDDTLDRTTDGTGRVDEHTRAALRGLDAGSSFHRRFAGERIPLLREVATLARAGAAGLFVEMKPGRHLRGGFERRLVRLLRRERLVEQTFVMSFDHRAVGRVKRMEPRLRCLLLVGDRMPLTKLVRAVRVQRADGVSFGKRCLSRAVLSEFRRRGWTAVVWTVNEAREMRAFLRMGVDGITTNFPGRLVRLRGSGAACQSR